MASVSESSTARLLQLLSLLQARRDWPGPELSSRLGASPRTIRKDISRLRALGYPIDATPGNGGGYRLRAGAILPPLLLSDDEALAVAISLRSAAAGTVEGLEHIALQALIKLEHLLPSRLRHRMIALQVSTIHAPTAGPRVEAEVLTQLATACRDRYTIRIDYIDHHGHPTRRNVEPHRLVHYGQRWFLLAWDLDRQDWRNLRVDRIQPRTPPGPRFTARTMSDTRAIERITHGVATAFGAIHARATIHAPAHTVAAKLPPVAVVEPLDTHSCTLLLGAATANLLAIYLLGLDADFEVTEPPELLDALDSIAIRAARAHR